MIRPTSFLARIMMWLVGIFRMVSTLIRLCSFSSSRFSMPRLFNISTNLTKISAVAPASSTALWWFSREIRSSLATVSSLKRFRFGSKNRAMETVSNTVGSKLFPWSMALCLIKLISKEALWATITASLQNSRNFGSTSSIFGAPRTMLSLMLVSFSISKGMGTSGLTKVENRSTIFPFSTFTAPISIILFFRGLKPVVSISNTTQVWSKDCPLESSASCFKSSTR